MISSEAEGCKGSESSCSASNELGGSTVVKGTFIEFLDNSVITLRSFSVVSHLCRELIKLLLGDGLNLFNDTPFDAFRARWRGEGAIIAPVVRHVNSAEELAHSDLFSGVIDGIKHAFEEGVRGGASLFHIEEDSDDGTIELFICVQRASIGGDTRALDDVHKMDLGIVKISVDSVL